MRMNTYMQKDTLPHPTPLPGGEGVPARGLREGIEVRQEPMCFHARCMFLMVSHKTLPSPVYPLSGSERFRKASGFPLFSLSPGRGVKSKSLYALSPRGIVKNVFGEGDRININTVELIHNVFPAKAGIQSHQAFMENPHWIPTFVGMTGRGAVQSFLQRFLIIGSPPPGEGW